MLRPHGVRAAVEDDRAGAAGVLRGDRRGADGAGEEGRQDGAVQGLRLHPLRQLRDPDEGPLAAPHDRRPVVRRQDSKLQGEHTCQLVSDDTRGYMSTGI